MLLPHTPPFRKHRRPARPGPAAAAAAPPLVVVEAYYDNIELLLTIVFDRAVDVGGFVGAAVTVADGPYNGAAYRGTGPATAVDPQTVRIALEETGAFAGAGVALSATALSGIVAVDDGGTWAGVTGLALPFP